MKVKYLEGGIKQNQPGKVELIPQEPEDIWISYNLITHGDTIKSLTTAKSPSNDPDYGARNRPKSSPVRIKLEIELRVTDASYDKQSSSLRIRGKKINSSAEDSIGGLFLSLELKINKPFVLGKICWDKLKLEKLKEARERPVGADLAVIVFRYRTAQIHLLGNRVTSLCSEIEDSKTKGGSGGGKFFESVFTAFVKYVDFESVKFVIIGSSDSSKDEFRRYLLSESRKKKLDVIENNRSRILSVGIKDEGTGNGFNNVQEVFDDITVMGKIRESKTGQEIVAYKMFVELIERNSDRICYGIEEVEYAVECGAIETLLVTDDLVRFSDGVTSGKYLKVVESVKKMGGKVCEYSVDYGYGEGLAKLTGVAAILRFPLHHPLDH